MENYIKIENEINDIKKQNQEAGNKLHNQLHRAQNAHWTRDELTDLLKSEEDVAGEFYNADDVQHAQIRNIQDKIISFYNND